MEVCDVLWGVAGWSRNNCYSQVKNSSGKDESKNLRYAVGPPGTSLVLLAAKKSGLWSHLRVAIAAILGCKTSNFDHGASSPVLSGYVVEPVCQEGLEIKGW